MATLTRAQLADLGIELIDDDAPAKAAAAPAPEPTPEPEPAVAPEDALLAASPYKRFRGRVYITPEIMKALSQFGGDPVIVTKSNKVGATAAVLIFAKGGEIAIQNLGEE